MIYALRSLHIRSRIAFAAIPRKHSIRYAYSSAMEPKFSPGEDGSKLTRETKALLEARWELTDTQMGLEKTFYFKTWTKVLVGDSSSLLLLYLTVAGLY
jgi:hypothetical protein